MTGQHTCHSEVKTASGTSGVSRFNPSVKGKDGGQQYRIIFKGTRLS